MRFIPASFHGLLDYAVAITLIAGPLLLGFEGLSKVIAMAGGVGLVLYSLLTDYSVSARKMIPFPVHLLFDFVAAVVLVAAPFVLGFEGTARLFYIVIGVAVIAVVLVTNPDVSTAEG